MNQCNFPHSSDFLTAKFGEKAAGNTPTDGNKCTLMMLEM